MEFMEFLLIILRSYEDTLKNILDNHAIPLIISGSILSLLGLIVMFLNHQTTKIVYTILSMISFTILEIALGLVILHEKVRHNDLASPKETTNKTYFNWKEEFNILAGSSIAISIIPTLLSFKYSFIGLVLTGLGISETVLILLLLFTNKTAILISVTIVTNIFIFVLLYKYKKVSQILITAFSGALLYNIGYALTLTGIFNLSSRKKSFFDGYFSDGCFWISIIILICLGSLFTFTHAFFVYLDWFEACFYKWGITSYIRKIQLFLLALVTKVRVRWIR